MFFCAGDGFSHRVKKIVFHVALLSNRYLASALLNAYTMHSVTVFCASLNNPVRYGKTSWSDMSRRNSSRVMILLASMRWSVNVNSPTFCAVPVESPLWSLNHSPRVAIAHVALGAYLMYPAMPVHHTGAVVVSPGVSTGVRSCP